MMSLLLNYIIQLKYLRVGHMKAKVHNCSDNTIVSTIQLYHGITKLILMSSCMIKTCALMLCLATCLYKRCTMFNTLLHNLSIRSAAKCLYTYHPTPTYQFCVSCICLLYTNLFILAWMCTVYSKFASTSLLFSYTYVGRVLFIVYDRVPTVC